MNYPQIVLLITATVLGTLAIVAVDANSTHLMIPEQKDFNDFRKDFQSVVGPIVVRQDDVESRLNEVERLADQTSSDSLDHTDTIGRIVRLYSIDSWVLTAGDDVSGTEQRVQACRDFLFEGIGDATDCGFRRNP